MAESNAALYVGSTATVIAVASIIYTASEVSSIKENIDINKDDIVKLARGLRAIEEKMKILEKSYNKLESTRSRIDKLKITLDDNQEALEELELLRSDVTSIISTLKDNDIQVKTKDRTKRKKRRHRKEKKKKEDEDDDEPDISSVLRLLSKK